MADEARRRVTAAEHVERPSATRAGHDPAPARRGAGVLGRHDGGRAAGGAGRRCGRRGDDYHPPIKVARLLGERVLERGVVGHLRPSEVGGPSAAPCNQRHPRR